MSMCWADLNMLGKGMQTRSDLVKSQQRNNGVYLATRLRSEVGVGAFLDDIRSKLPPTS
jgi:hypothetical protein